jgi:hypothetical protein
VRRFFYEGEQCHNDDIQVIERESHNKVRLAIFAKGEWIAVVYHIRYCAFVTFLPPEVLLFPS